MQGSEGHPRGSLPGIAEPASAAVALARLEAAAAREEEESAREEWRKRWWRRGDSRDGCVHKKAGDRRQEAGGRKKEAQCCFCHTSSLCTLGDPGEDSRKSVPFSRERKRLGEV